jgi:hypothetical protein
MKKQRILFLFASLFMASMLFVACQGPQGEPGVDGVDGAAGLNGSDGTDGVDGNVVCLQCHNLKNKADKEMQFAQSVHATGTTYSRGGSKSCGECHSHEGFVETEFTGYDTLATEIPYPHGFKCETCHDFHATFDFENEGPDYSWRTTNPVTMKTDGSVIDFKNSANLCGQCHQARTPAPDASLDSFAITSTHWGPPH